ncbi:unnamed protein product [marine sediment metagenome]|uniref:PKD domain-containing protein n=1 Tax=marine sediment metagenome TaxID=412755 RepID=X1KCT7_9ZZZZ
MYTTAGIYTVTLTVDDAAGNGPASDTLEVNVSAAPAIEVTITRFSARDVRKDNYAITAQIKNEGTTAVTITASVDILDGVGNVVVTLVDKTVTIGAGGRVNLKWDDFCELDPGSYIAKVTVDEEPEEWATDTFEVK